MAGIKADLSIPASLKVFLSVIFAFVGDQRFSITIYTASMTVFTNKSEAG
jgi:hypothetical protein